MGSISGFSVSRKALAALVAILLLPGVVAVPVAAEYPVTDIYTDDDDYTLDDEELTVEVDVNPGGDIDGPFELWIDHNNDGEFDAQLEDHEFSPGDRGEEIEVNLHDYATTEFDDTDKLGDEENLVRIGLVDPDNNNNEIDSELVWLEACNWDSPDGVHHTCEGGDDPYEGVLSNIYSFGWAALQYLGFLAVFAGATLWFGTGDSAKYSSIGMWLFAGGMMLMLLYFGFDTLVELLRYAAGG